MKYILLNLFVMLFFVSSCSKNRESYMDADFTSITESAGLSAFPSSISTNKNIAVDNFLPFQTQTNDPKLFTILTNPTNGQVVLVNSSTGEYIYTPNNNYVGPDSFSWKINQNGKEASSIVNIIVTSSGNRAPQAIVENYTTPEDIQLIDSVQASDPDNDSITITVVNQTQNGTISLNSATGAFIYQPNLNYTGVDSFTYTVSDGLITIGPFTSNITVTPVNDSPIALNNNYSINKNASLNGQVLATDVDSSSLSYSVVSQTSNGQLFFNANGTFNYQPNSNYTGTDSFTFKASDGQLDSNIATVTISINSINPPPPINNPPVANNLNISTNEDVAVNIQLSGLDPENSVLSYTLLSNPTKGFISGSGSTRTYTPFANVSGTDSFTYKVNDGQLDSNVATVSITINPVNDAPVASNLSLSINSNQSISSQAVATDIDSTLLNYTLMSQPTKGTVSFNANGSFTYQPNLNSSGVDSFTFKANDGQLDSNIATITININSTNLAPVANNKQITIQEDALLNSNVSGTDSNSDPLTFTLVSNTNNGSLNLQSNGTFTYQPNLNFNGTDSFTFKVNDGQLDSNIATVTINIIPVNDAPIASNLNLQVQENQSITNNLIGTDVDSTTILYSIVTQPTNGTVSLNATSGQFTYIPNLNFNGTDSFTFKVNDGQLDSNIATVTINVTPINSAPIANNLTKSISEDTVLTSNLIALDPDSTTLVYSIVAQPSNGTLSVNSANGQFIYTPNLNFNGIDSFTYKANDGQLDSNIATVTINVTPVNDAPIAFNANFSVNQNQSYNGQLIATDIDSSILTYSIMSQPTKGTISLNAANGQFTYTANSMVTGIDSFTFKVNDGQLDSNIATVTVNLNLLNIAPIATNLTLLTNEDIALSNNLLGSDINGDVISYSIVSQSQNGSVVVNSTTGSFVYTPNLNFNGTDSFTYKVNDGQLDSNIATVFISVIPVNDSPVALNNTFAISKNATLSNILNATDVDSNVLFYSIVTNPQFGSISLNPFNGQFVYIPNNNYTGSDSFTFKVNDGQSDSNIATISININQLNNSPIANNQSFSINEDTVYNGTLTGLDLDNDIISFSGISLPSKGVVSINPNGSFVYTPNLNATGNDSFTFKVNDGQLDSNIATVSITINPVNDAPIANNGSFTIQEDTILSQVLSASDVDSTTLSFSLVTQATKGIVTINPSGSFVYTPSLNATGNDSFTFKVNDGQLDSNIATISITINPVNDAPIANNQNIINNGSFAIPITLTGSDPEGNMITYTVLSQPSNGTISGIAPNLTYTPNNNITQNDSFTFKVNDGQLDSNIATISISFTAIAEQDINPIVECVQAKSNGTYYARFGYNNTNPFSVSVPIGTNNSFTPVPQNRGQPVSFSIGRQVNVFKVNNIPNGTLVWNIKGKTATASQSFASCNDSNNNAPVANNQSISIQEDQSTAVILTASDIDGDLLDYTIVMQPANGTLSGSAPNLTYTPNNNYHGTDSFTFKVNDGLDDSNIATVSINISAVNDAPITQNQSLSINKNTQLNGQLIASDIDSATLNYFIITQATNGIVSVNSSTGQFTYTPNNNYVGSDSFTFKVNDGQLDSNISTVQITVLNTNTAPIAQNQTYQVNEDTLFNGQLTATDIDGNSLSYSIVSQTTNGTINVSSNGSFTYQPNLNYTGMDSFTFKANDGQLDSNIATISLNINPINDPPTANNQTITVDKNSINNLVTLIGTDIENSSLSFIIVSNPQNGTISGTGSNRTYSPNNGYTGIDSFTFKVNDGQLDSNIATVSINVISNNNNWCNQDNQYQNKLVLNNQDHGLLNNFPVLVKLNSSRITYSDLLPNATDLYFYDEECNQLDHEIEQWNVNGDSFVWVKVPKLNPNKNDSFIWMSYGGTNTTNNQNKIAVWNNNFAGVWHMSDVSTSSIKDSTSNINTLLKTGEPTQNMSGKIARSIGFSCEPDGYIEQNESISLRVSNAITLESWVFLSECSSDDVVIEKYYQSSSGKKIDYSLLMDNCRPKIRVGSKYSKFDTALSLNKWHHITATFNGATNTCKIFVNGVLKKTDTNCTDDLSGLGGYKMKIGSNIDGKNMIYGRLDEVRVSNIERSNDWISAQYLSMNDGSISFGSRRMETDEWNHDLLTIKNNLDDGKIYSPTNTLYSSGHNGIAYQGSQSNQNIWGYYRFQLPSSIPANALIKKVMLRLYGKDKTSNWTSQKLQVALENSANAATVTNANQFPGGSGGRTQLPEQLWGSPNLSWGVDSWNDSPNLKNSLVNLLIAKGELFQNNHIQLWITRPLDANTNLVEVGSEDSAFEEKNHAQLMIEWE